MEELKKVLASLLSEKLYQIIISNPRQKAGAFKIKVRPVMVKEQVVFQRTVYEGTKVFHDNLDRQAAIDEITRYMEQDFRQLEGESTELKATALVSKKGKITVKAIRKKTEKGEAGQGILPDLSHNRVKKYILEEGKPVPFLVDLGVQTKDGRVVHARYDKFRQINRYLEFVEDVIDHCNALAEKYGYDKLCFLKGDIARFEGAEKVDMVVTLHACDTATDYALKKAIEWNARVIFSVPCCQHEVNKQIENELFSPVFKYGLIRERMSALLTDAVRANLLEEQGYDTQILEFIDMEHTPKNILIRAVKNKESGKTGISEVTDFFHVNTTLQKLLSGKE